MIDIATNVFELFAKLGLDSSEYEKGLSGAKSLMGKVGSGIVSGLKIAAKVGAAAIGTAAAAATKFAKDSVAVGRDFDKAMSQVAATAGKTMDDMLSDIQTVTVNGKEFTGNLRDYALEMGSTTAFSANQAAEALNYMALAGYDTVTSMEMLPNVLNLAAAGGMELARASDMVTDVSSALGLSLDETSQLVDKMAAAASKSNTSVEQLGDAMLTIGGTAKNLRGGTTELSTALGILADNGIKGAEGGTHLRNVILSLQSPTDDAAAKLTELGVSVYDAQGNMRGMNEIFGELSEAMSDMTSQEQDMVKTTLFNKTDLSAVNALLANMGDRYDELSTAIDGAWYSSTSLQNALGNVGADMSTMQGSLAKIGISVDDFNAALAYSNGNAEDFAATLWEWTDAGTSYDDVLGALGISLEDLQTAFDSTAGAAQAMADTQLDNLDGDITLFKSALEGAQVTVSDALTPSLRDFVQIGTDGVTKLTEAFKEGGLTGAISALGPILEQVISKASEMIPSIIAVATEIVTALAVTLPTLLQALLPPLISGTVQVVTALAGQLPAILSIISDAMPTLIDAFLSILPDLISTGLEIIAQLALGIAQALPTLIPTIVDVVLQIVDTLIDHIDLLIDAAIQFILGLAEGLIQALPKLIQKAPEIVRKLVSAIVDNLPLIIDAAIQLIGALTEALLSNLEPLLTAALEIILALTQGLIQAIPDLLMAVPKLVTELLAALISSAPSMMRGGVEFVQAVISGIVNTTGSLIESVLDLVSQVLDNLISSAARLIDAGKEMVESVKNGFKQKIEDAKTWGRDLIQNFISGIIEKVGAVVDAVKGVGSKIKSFLGFSEPDEGPLSDFHTYAPDMMKLFADGIGQNEGLISGKMQALASTVANLTRGLKDTAVNIWTSMQNGISGIVDRIKSFISTAWDGIKSTTSAVLGVIGQTVSNSLNAVRNTVTTIINAVRSVISSVLNAIQTTVSNIWNNIRNAISNAMNAIRTNISNIWNSVKSAVSGAITGIRTTIVNGFESAVDYIKSLPSQALQWGKDIIGGIVNGIKSKVSAVTDAVSGVAGKIKSFLHFSVPDEGPLTDYESWMPDFMKGLAGSIDRSRYMVQDAIERVAESMQISATAELAGVNTTSSSAPANDTVIRQNSTTVSYAGANLNVYVNGATAEDRQYGNNLAEQIAEALARLTSDNNARMGALA